MKIVKFFEEVKKEAVKISWIGKKELSLSTLSVFFIVGIFSIFFLLVDLASSNLITYILGVAK
jgi:preprotein translocase SecE subunit